MKKRLKKIMTLAIVSAMLLGNTFTAQAASHAKGCAATGQTQVCSRSHQYCPTETSLCK